MTNRAAKAYTKIRTGKLFLIILSSICVAWCSWNTLAPVAWQFDPASHGFPLLTLILSIEASIAASVIIMSNQESDALQKDQLKYALHLSEAILEILEHQKEAKARKGVPT